MIFMLILLEGSKILVGFIIRASKEDPLLLSNRYVWHVFLEEKLISYAVLHVVSVELTPIKYIRVAPLYR